MENKPCLKCGLPADCEIMGDPYCQACVYKTCAEKEEEENDDKDYTPSRPE